MTISEKMRWQIRVLDKGSHNSQDGLSAIQVSDTNTKADRAALQKEIKQILEEIDRIGDTTEFNTKPLFKGSFNRWTIHQK